jgi:hypothetical protein
MMMQLCLIQGQFIAQDALNILADMIRVKIRYHEAKIEAGAMEEDIHMRERHISELQDALHQLRQNLPQGSSLVNMEATVTLQ